ncbi:MAG: glycosyltransferase family 2 protein [Aulosira sp. ZfuVER01]|nr:glycosyltransferase family 2 protein [Aulosira sp. ZfuVER01]MDZ8000773.1 glycosyltransferase family 2 protein [Aulosira sp. DedVER01a]MDZ8055082.1 glycosyltransferase family 2 protein [Aulosira sp. ZfuCHP01]
MDLATRNFDNTKNKQSISIIVPCFNESEGIEALKKKILPRLADLRLLGTVELICVDDGSTDDTFSKLQQYLGKHAQIIRHPKNKGLSAAIRTGILHSTGNIICTLDSDCTYDPKQLIALLDLMSPGVDIVTASPYHPEGRVKNVSAWRLFLSKGLSQLYRLVLPQRLYTYTSMFRAYRREVLESVPITHPGFLGMVEILAEAMLRGYKVVEYPAELSIRVFGQSKLRVARVIWSHLKYISKLIFRQILQQKKSQIDVLEITKNNY